MSKHLEPQVLALDPNESLELDDELRRQKHLEKDPLTVNKAFLKNM